MNTKDFTIFKITNQYFNKDLKEQVKDLKLVIRILIEMTDNLHNAKVPIVFYRSYMEALLVKLSMHASTLVDIVEGTNIYSPISKKNIKYPDLPSIYLLIRAIIENYLTIYYLCIQPKNEQAEFRYYLFQLAGLSSRQKFEVSFPGIKQDLEVELSKKKANEASQIDELLSKIKSNPYFLSLKKEKQTELLKKRNAKELNWAELIKQSNLKEEFFLNQWRLYSNYAHAEMLSSLQLREYFTNPKMLQSALFTSIISPVIINSILIKELIKMYPVLEIIYNALPVSTTTIIDYWDNFGTRRQNNP